MAAAPLQSALERAAAEREANLFGKNFWHHFSARPHGAVARAGACAARIGAQRAHPFLPLPLMGWFTSR